MRWWILARRRIFNDIAEEIEQHLTEKTDALMAGGMGRKEAEAAARREVGNVVRIMERSREPWLWAKTESVLTDVRLAFRRLWKSPGFALTAIVTLALAIGANVVVFSVVIGLMLRPLAVLDPGNLYQVMQAKQGWYSQSYRDYVDLRDRDPSFSGLMAHQVQR